MFLQRITKFLVILLVSLFTITAFADDIFWVQYIKKTWDNSYRIFGTNFWTDISALRVFLGTKEMTNVTKSIKDNYIDVSNLYNDWWDLILEKSVTTTSSGKTSTVKTKSSAIKFIRDDSTLLKNSYTIESRNWKDVYLIPLVNWYVNWQQFVNYWITEKTPVININWVDAVLTKELSNYEDGKYYYNKGFIIFPVKNLKLSNNIIRIKFDWFFSNYIIIKKELYNLSKPTSVIIEDYSGSKYIKFIFNKPSNITEINNTEAYINWVKVVANDYTITSNNLSVRYDIAKLNKDDKVVKIFLKNNITLDFSNTVIVNIESKTDNKIVKVDLWENKYQNFTLKFTWTNAGWFMGDISKLKLFLNGKEYNSTWTKEVIKTSTWASVKDGNWKDVYQYNRMIKFSRSWEELSADFLYSNFTGWLNVMYIRNENTLRESNKISFTKGSYSTINYNYVAGTVVPVIKEEIVYTNWADISDKSIDFLNKPDRDIILGKFSFNNLVSTNFYRIYFKLATNLKYNPLYSIKLWLFNLEPITESDWTISYVFDNSAYGKDLVSSNLILNLSELSYLTDMKIKFSLSGLNISKYDYTTSELSTIFENKSSTDINMSYLYNFWECFDGGKDYCNLDKLSDPSLLVNLAFGSELKNPVVTNQPITTTTPQLTTSNTKKNSPINTLDYKINNNKVLNGKFINLYNSIKAKNITTKQNTSLKNSINAILQALKDIEDNKSKSAANSTIKTNLRIIIDIIKSTK